MNINKAVNLESQLADYNIRPKYLSQFVGQQELKNNLHTFIQAAKLRSTTLDHVLLSGPPGLGKTTLGQIMANEMMVDITSTSGPLIEKQKDLAALLTNLQKGQVLFIDEIHRMNRQIEEVLYGAMEDFKLDIMIGNGPSARTMKIDLPPFTLVAATTRLGMLSSPLRDRFGIPLRIEYYNTAELMKIIRLNADNLNIKIESAAAKEIASRARGTPRLANRLLKRCHDFALVKGGEDINLEIVKYALKELNIDPLGLDLFDRRYLSFIADSAAQQPIGLNTISIALSEDKDSIELTCEPYLIRLGFIKKTSRGRIITSKGRQYILEIKKTP